MFPLRNAAVSLHDRHPYPSAVAAPRVGALTAMGLFRRLQGVVSMSIESGNNMAITKEGLARDGAVDEEELQLATGDPQSNDPS